MSDGIPLHPEHGLNPTMTQCFVCGGPKDILLIGNKTQKFEEAGLCDKDGKMPMSVGAMDYAPCDECVKLMDMGVILISVKDGQEGEKNPYRTGRFCVVKDEWITRTLTQEMSQKLMDTRVAFIEDSLWEMLGLPNENIDRRPSQ